MLVGIAGIAGQRTERVFGQPERADQSENRRFSIKVWGYAETAAANAVRLKYQHTFCSSRIEIMGSKTRDGALIMGPLYVRSSGTSILCMMT